MIISYVWQDVHRIREAHLPAKVMRVVDSLLPRSPKLEDFKTEDMALVKAPCFQYRPKD